MSHKKSVVVNEDGSTGMSDKCYDWGVCCRGCQCARYQVAIACYHPFLPGLLPPPHLREKTKTISFIETPLVVDPQSMDLRQFTRWMVVDPTLSLNREQPKWNP